MGGISRFLCVRLVWMYVGEEPSIGEWTMGNIKLLPPLGRRVVAPNLLFLFVFANGRSHSYGDPKRVNTGNIGALEERVAVHIHQTTGVPRGQSSVSYYTLVVAWYVWEPSPKTPIGIFGWC